MSYKAFYSAKRLGQCKSAERLDKPTHRSHATREFEAQHGSES
jgi:hypothetical protein